MANIDFQNSVINLTDMAFIGKLFCEKYREPKKLNEMKKQDWQRMLELFRDVRVDGNMKILMEGDAYFENLCTARFPDQRKIALDLHDFDDEYLYGCLIYFVYVEDCVLDDVYVLQKILTKVKIDLNSPQKPWLVMIQGEPEEIGKQGAFRIQILPRPFMGYDMYKLC